MMLHRIPRARRRLGYTLPEILIVVVIIGIMSAVALRGMTSTRATFVLDRAVQEVQSELRRAQSEAIRRNRRVTVSRVNDSTYQVALTTTGTVLVQSRLPWPVKFTSGSSASLIIQSFGHPTAGANFIVTNNGQRRTVAINAMGRLTVTSSVPL